MFVCGVIDFYREFYIVFHFILLSNQKLEVEFLSRAMILNITLLKKTLVSSLCTTLDKSGTEINFAIQDENITSSAGLIYYALLLIPYGKAFLSAQFT